MTKVHLRKHINYKLFTYKHMRIRVLLSTYDRFLGMGLRALRMNTVKMCIQSFKKKKFIIWKLKFNKINLTCYLTLYDVSRKSSWTFLGTKYRTCKADIFLWGGGGQIEMRHSGKRKANPLQWKLKKLLEFLLPFSGCSWRLLLKGVLSNQKIKGLTTASRIVNRT